jgi:hypothetical protein
MILWDTLVNTNIKKKKNILFKFQIYVDNKKRKKKFLIYLILTQNFVFKTSLTIINLFSKAGPARFIAFLAFICRVIYIIE